VIILDDVISTGSTLQGMHMIMEKAGADVVAEAAILTEGERAKWSNIISLGHIPVFTDSSMLIRIGIENNIEGRTLAWALDYPGCFAYGMDEAEALINLPKALLDYEHWIKITPMIPGLVLKPGYAGCGKI
jgi:hypothetical protein